MIRVWGCRRCGVVTDTLDGYGWCRDCVTVEALYRRLENYRTRYAADPDAGREARAARSRACWEANRERYNARARESRRLYGRSDRPKKAA
jgi:hypothetical protein